jgi:hypothetical protein
MLKLVSDDEAANWYQLDRLGQLGWDRLVGLD